MKSTAALICGLSLMSSSCATKTLLLQHAEFNTRREAIKNIVVVPPLVEINRKTADGKVGKLTDEAASVNSNLTEFVVKEFSTRGYKVVREQDAQSKDSNLASSSQMAFQELSGAVWNRLPEEEAKAKDYKYALSNVPRLTGDTSADAIVFVKFIGFTRSGGDIASEAGTKLLVGVLTGGLFVPPKDPSGFVLLGMALVDGRSGDVLWANRVGDTYWGVTGPDFMTDDLSPLISKLIAEFPR